jgi:hypothetical protein
MATRNIILESFHGKNSNEHHQYNPQNSDGGFSLPMAQSEALTSDGAIRGFDLDDK